MRRPPCLPFKGVPCMRPRLSDAARRASALILRGGGPGVASMGRMRVEAFRFGSVRIDGHTYEHDVVIAGGAVRKRIKRPSKPFRARYGHTPLSLEEKIPW